jgi:hypothetical protein
VWFLATGDQADAWQILARDVYLAVEAQEEPLDSKAVQAIYVQAKQPGKAGGSIRVELPIDELLLR